MRGDLCLRWMIWRVGRQSRLDFVDFLTTLTSFVESVLNSELDCNKKEETTINTQIRNFQSKLRGYG